MNCTDRGLIILKVRLGMLVRETKVQIKKEWKKNILGLVSIVLFGLYPCLFIYFKNAGEVRILDVTPIILVYLIVAAILLAICYLVFRNLAKAIAMTNTLMVALCNFELFSVVFGDSRYRYLFVTVIVVAVLLGAGFLFRRLKEGFVINLNEVFCVVFGVMILMNAVPAIPTIIHKMTAEVKKGPELRELEIEKVNPETAPNVYYMIFDEYGGKQNLEVLLDYDNSDFLNGLREKGFNVSDNSYNRESIYTVVVVPNLLNLDYVTNDDMVGEERNDYMMLPDLYLIMERLGYEINTCSHIAFLDNSISKQKFRSVNYFENQAGYAILKRSLFFHLYTAFANEQSRGYGEDLIASMEYYKKLSNMASEEELPQFCLAYFQTPHMPFAFEEDGTPVSEPEKESWTIERYLSYLKWTNSKIEEILSHIIGEDPNAIIIVQSDHGARYELNSVGIVDLNEMEELSQHNILNCVYYKGEIFDVDGLSGINTLRKVLNSEYGLDLKMIEYQPMTEE